MRNLAMTCQHLQNTSAERTGHEQPSKTRQIRGFSLKALQIPVQLPTWGFWQPILLELSPFGRCSLRPFGGRCWLCWTASGKTGRRSRRNSPPSHHPADAAEGDHDANRHAALAERLPCWITNDDTGWQPLMLDSGSKCWRGRRPSRHSRPIVRDDLLTQKRPSRAGICRGILPSLKDAEASYNQP